MFVFVLRSFVAVLALSLSLAITADAAAADLAVADAAAAEEPPWTARAQGTRIGLEFDWWPSRGWSATDTAHLLSWTLTGQIKFARAGYIDVDLPWAVLDKVSHQRRETIPELGNPVLGLHFAETWNNKIAFFAGGTITVSTLLLSDPISESPEPDTGRSTNELRHVRRAAVTSRAYADAPRFVPFRFFLRGRTGIELRLLPELYYRSDLTPILAVPITQASEHAEFIFEIHNEIEARGSFGFGGGVHVQAVFLSADERAEINRYDGDPVQTAVEPYVVFEPIRGFFARAGALIALDPGVGIGSEADHIVTLRTALGAKW